MNFLDFIETNDFHEESDIFSKQNFYLIFEEKKLCNFELIIDVEKTLENSNLIFLRYKRKISIIEDQISSNFIYDNKNNSNQNINYLINSNVKELAKGFKYNIKMNYLRIKDIVICEKNSYALLFINSQFFLKIKESIHNYFSNKNNLVSYDLIFKLFYDKIILTILDNIKIVPKFYYPKKKFISMLDELIITIKNLIHKYYN